MQCSSCVNLQPGEVCWLLTCSPLNHYRSHALSFLPLIVWMGRASWHGRLELPYCLYLDRRTPPLRYRRFLKACQRAPAWLCLTKQLGSDQMNCYRLPAHQLRLTAQHSIIVFFRARNASTALWTARGSARAGASCMLNSTVETSSVQLAWV